MPRARAIVLGCALGLATAGLSSCGGGSSDDLIPQQNAEAIKAALDQVAEPANQGLCDTAANATAQVRAQLARLPASVNPDVRRVLFQGTDRLKTLAENPATCHPTTTTTPTTPTTATTATAPPTQTTTTQTQTQKTTPTTPTTPTGGTGTGGAGAQSRKR